MAKDNTNYSFALIAIVAIVAIVGLVMMYINMGVGATQYITAPESSCSDNSAGLAAVTATIMPASAGLDSCVAKCGKKGGGVLTQVRNGVTVKDCYCY